jgi:hypothetical protein
MPPFYSDTLEDTFPLLLKKRKLEEEIEQARLENEMATKRMEMSERVVEYIKAEKPKPKKKVMTLGDLPHEDIFGRIVDPEEDEDVQELSVPYSGVGRRLKDGRPFMYTAFYDGHEITIALVGCTVALLLLGIRQLRDISNLHLKIVRLHELVVSQHTMREDRAHYADHQRFVVPRFA